MMVYILYNIRWGVTQPCRFNICKGSFIQSLYLPPFQTMMTSSFQCCFIIPVDGQTLCEFKHSNSLASSHCCIVILESLLLTIIDLPWTFCTHLPSVGIITVVIHTSSWVQLAAWQQQFELLQVSKLLHSFYFSDFEFWRFAWIGQ